MSSIHLHQSERLAAIGWRDAADQARAFKSARRHSLLVRVLRLLLPLCAVLIVAGLVIAEIPTFLLLNVPISISGISFKNGGLTMENPRLHGFGRNEQSYELSAKAASQDILNPKIVQLDDIVARIGEADGSTTSLTAKSGVFDSAAEMLQLKDGIVIDSASGYHMELSNAEIDLNKGIVHTKDRVQLKMMDGDLIANSMSVENRGEVVRFEGGVRLTFTPKSRDKE